jgi:hypothetical protein
MCFYIEDGVEENSLFEYNLASFISPIYRPAAGSSLGENFVSGNGLLNPADTSASGFYISNAMNTFIGNTASGGWSGFAFPNVVAPLGNFQGTLPANSNYAPMRRPLKKFYGNTAHSSGFYWSSGGSCIYVGALLYYNTSSGLLTYNDGRNSRSTIFGNGTTTFFFFEQTKTFLCNFGITHWGNNVQIESAEMHDSIRSAFLFGSVAVHNTLMNLNSLNPNNQLFSSTSSRVGYRFYDTSVKVRALIFFCA